MAGNAGDSVSFIESWTVNFFTIKQRRELTMENTTEGRDGYDGCGIPDQGGRGVAIGCAEDRRWP